MKKYLSSAIFRDESVWEGCEIESLDQNGIMELLIHFHLAAEVRTKEYDQAVKHYFLPVVLKSFHGDPNEVPSGYLQYAVPLHILFPTRRSKCDILKLPKCMQIKSLCTCTHVLLIHINKGNMLSKILSYSCRDGSVSI